MVPIFTETALQQIWCPPFIPGVAYRAIHRPYEDLGYSRWLLGVAIEEYEGEYYACWGVNDGEENTITEYVEYSTSADKGCTWSKPMRATPPSDRARSHSVYCVHQGKLWMFTPSFDGTDRWPRKNVVYEGTKLVHSKEWTERDWALAHAEMTPDHMSSLTGRPSWNEFLNISMEAWVLENKTWRCQGRVADRFWPLSAPIRMDNGNWIQAGCDIDWLSGIAISHGDDFTKWDVFHPDTGGEQFNETSLWVHGPHILAVMRNVSLLSRDGTFHAACTQSHDYGRTWSKCELTNFPMSPNKPFCGILSDGRPYLLFSVDMGNSFWRGRLLLALGSGKEESFFTMDKVYFLDVARMLKYPYAIERDGMLYIAYATQSNGPDTKHNQNDARLLTLPIANL